MNVIVINTELMSVFGVFKDEDAAGKAIKGIEPNTLMADTMDHLAALTGPELVRLHNSLEGGVLVNKFVDKATAIRRVWSRLENLELMKAKKVEKIQPNTAQGNTAQENTTQGNTAQENTREQPAKKPGPRSNAVETNVITMIPHDPESKRWHKGSIRKSCYDRLVELTRNGKEAVTVEEFLLQMTEDRNIVLGCLHKLCDNTGQKTATFALDGA